MPRSSPTYYMAAATLVGPGFSPGLVDLVALFISALSSAFYLFSISFRVFSLGAIGAPPYLNCGFDIGDLLY